MFADELVGFVVGLDGNDNFFEQRRGFVFRIKKTLFWIGLFIKLKIIYRCLDLKSWIILFIDELIP